MGEVELLATTGDDQSVLIWNTSSMQPRVRLPHHSPIGSLTSSRNGARLAALNSQQVLIWDWPDTPYE